MDIRKNQYFIKYKITKLISSIYKIYFHLHILNKKLNKTLLENSSRANLKLSIQFLYFLIHCLLHWVVKKKNNNKHILIAAKNE